MKHVRRVLLFLFGLAIVVVAFRSMRLRNAPLVHPGVSTTDFELLGKRNAIRHD